MLWIVGELHLNVPGVRATVMPVLLAEGGGEAAAGLLHINELTNILWTIVALGWDTTGSVADRVLALLEPRLDELPPRGIVNVAWAVAASAGAASHLPILRTLTQRAFRSDVLAALDHNEMQCVVHLLGPLR